MSQPAAVFWQESDLPTQPQVAVCQQEALCQATVCISVCADIQLLRAQGTLQAYPEVPSECVWLGSEGMRDAGSQICTSLRFKALSWHLCPSLGLWQCIYSVLLHVPLLINLWALYYGASVGKCSLSAFTAPREHDRKYCCFPTSDFRGQILRKTFDQKAAPARCLLERKNELFATCTFDTVVMNALEPFGISE